MSVLIDIPESRAGLVIPVTLISTFVMAAVLEGAGFFRWVADRLTERAAGSGRRLFHLVLAFSACLTLFLNNDGSILLGTPVVLGLVRHLRLLGRARFGYLIGGCLVASAASAPIGVSNMANLEAMALVGVTLTEHTREVLIPALLGLGACWALLHAVFARDLPADLGRVGHAADPPRPEPHRPGPHRRHHGPPPRPPGPPPPPHLRHPPPPAAVQATPRPDYPFMWFAVAVVVLVRGGFFVASVLGIPPYVVAAVGAVTLLVGNLHRRVMDARTALQRAPWPILGFAFGMDLVVFGLRNAGLTGALAGWMGPLVSAQTPAAAVLPGAVAAGVSALLNNHPGLIIGSLTLLEMPGLSHGTLNVAYASVVLGSDLGALFTPIGTLASLLWLHVLRQHGVGCSWWDYVRVTLAVIPASFILALAGLFGMALLTGR